MEKTATYVAAGSLQALVGLVQWGVVELHPCGSRMPHPEKPDRLSRLRHDPWRDFAATRQTVTASMFKRVGLTAGVNGD